MILSVQKQPGANTLDLTREIDRVLDDLQRTLPAGVVIEKENFRQADFIEVAIRNVSVALRDGAVLVRRRPVPLPRATSARPSSRPSPSRCRSWPGSW